MTSQLTTVVHAPPDCKNLKYVMLRKSVNPHKATHRISFVAAAPFIEIEFSFAFCFDDNNNRDQLFYWVSTASDVRLLIFGAPGLYFISQVATFVLDFFVITHSVKGAGS